MKKIIAVIVFLSPFFIQAQKKDKQPKDSLHYYYAEMGKLRRTYWDSLHKSKEYLALMENINRLSNNRNEYGGFMMGAELMHSEYNAFNKNIAGSGFPALKPYTMRIYFGIAVKDNHNMFDIYFASIGFNNKSVKAGEEIKTGVSNMMQVNYGYDLLNSKYASIYPYAGLSLRMAYLRYRKAVEINPNYTNVSNIINNNQQVTTYGRSFGYQLGLAVDITIVNGIIFNTRFGTSRPIGEEQYDIEGATYKPGFKQGDWMLGFGFKLTSPR